MTNHKRVFQVQVLFEPDGENIHVYCPSLKGLHVDGKSIEEAKKNAEDAIIAYLKSLIKHGDPIPVGCEIPPDPPKRTRRILGTPELIQVSV